MSADATSENTQAKVISDEVMEKLPELFDMEDIRSRVDEFTPYIMVAIQVPSAACCKINHSMQPDKGVGI